MTDSIIFDIDGTLADVEHRRHHVSGSSSNWGAFFDEMVDDPPLADVVFLAELIADGANAPALFLFSGRPESHRPQTETWLEEHVPSYFAKSEALLMRAADDYRQDTIVKKEMLQVIRGRGYEPRIVVDDRPSVVQMWRDEGITVLAHDSGDWDNTPITWEPGNLHIMIGPAGAGKSTWLRNQLETGTTYWLTDESAIISTDRLRGQLTGDFRDQSKNDQVFAAAHMMAEARLKSGLDVVIDATNLHAKNRKALLGLLPDGGRAYYYVIDRPLEDKHATAGWRDDIVMADGQKLIDKHDQSFKSGLNYILAGDNDPRVTVLDKRKEIQNG